MTYENVSRFITDHPTAAFGVFLICMTLVGSIGKIGRRKCCCKESP